MSITSVTQTPPLLTTDTHVGSSQRHKDFQALAQALASGNLSDAQSAFSAWQTDLQTARAGKGQPSTAATKNQPLSDAINALSKALQSGNLNDAKSAFSALQQAMKDLFQGHRTGHGSNPPPTQSGIGRDNDGDNDNSSPGARINTTA